ncbi:MAG: aminotransferase class V-fold PLP-dependent enzyme [Thermoplasmatales archaeon]|nr:MAG: aminotransferase class V-fold PLP-dependent enzyme [Thermoplasmatales archaeon]
MAISFEFGSDNHSGVHPEIMKAIENANKDYTIAYGNDKYTVNAIKKFKEHFGEDIEVFFVYNGTAANILGLKNVTNSFNSIFCAETAHLNVHECCGPEKFTGCKLVTIPTPNGKLTVNLIKPLLVGFGDEHMAQPKVVSITQPTELGTLYTSNEIKALADFVHKNKMLLHVDGARLSNAAASMKKSLREITKDLGVDLLSFGGTKNGMMFGEAVVFFNKNLSKNFKYIRKQGMQLASKMRFISCQFYEFLSNDLWLINAKHANKMAQLLYKKVKDISDIKITQKVDCNSIFAIISKKYVPILQKKYFFHVFDDDKSEVRWMCSFDTKEKNVLDFANTIKKTLSVK